MVSLVKSLARQRTTSGSPVVSRYNPQQRIAEVWEDDAWVPSWASRTVPQSKKADIETGEDQKGQ